MSKKKKATVKKAPRRCLFCYKEFEDGEQPEMVKSDGRPAQFFHYKCYVSWRDTVRRGGVTVYV